MAASNKVVVISQVPPPTHGSTLMTRILLEVLTEAGIATKLVDRRFSRFVGEVGVLSLRKLAAVPSLVGRLTAAVMGARRTCVFFCTNRPFSFLVDVLLGEVLRVFRVPTVNYIHTTGWTTLARRGRIWKALVRRLLSHAERTVCLGESLVTDIAPFVGGKPISIIPNTIEVRSIDVPHGRRAEGNEGDVLFLSNLIEEKGADIFVDMAISLCNKYADVNFALVGQVADFELVDELRRRIAESGHGARVQLLGPKYGDEKWQVLSDARLLVFPSRYRFEAQPLTIIEAMSVGVPVVASDVGAIGEMISDENGFLLSTVSAQAAVEAVVTFIDQPARRKEASLAAKRTYESKYSREAFRSAWMQVLKATASQR